MKRRIEIEFEGGCAKCPLQFKWKRVWCRHPLSLPSGGEIGNLADDTEVPLWCPCKEVEE